jgi:hypothetical protein
MLTLEQLTTPITEAEAEAEVIQRLSELGFASKGWQSGSMALTLGVKLPAWLISRFTRYINAVAKAGSNETAEGDFQTRFSRSHYANERKVSVAAQYTVRHTVASGEGPHTGIQLGDLIASNGTHTYRNVTTADLTSAAVVDLVYEAEEPGSAANTEDESITELVTPLAGVTITNPLGSILRAGSDKEQDAVLRTRNTDRWSQLSIEAPADGYRGVCLGVEGVDRCEVDDTNPRGPYTIDIYVAAANAPRASSCAPLRRQRFRRGDPSRQTSRSRSRPSKPSRFPAWSMCSRPTSFRRPLPSRPQLRRTSTLCRLAASR